jgi:hypothetical protein
VDLGGVQGSRWAERCRSGAREAMFRASPGLFRQFLNWTLAIFGKKG